MDFSNGDRILALLGCDELVSRIRESLPGAECRRWSHDILTQQANGELEGYVVLLLDAAAVESDCSKVISFLLEKNPGLRVILLSPTADRNRLNACIKAGADDFLLAPYSMKELKERVIASKLRGNRETNLRVLSAGPFLLHKSLRKVTRGEAELQLTESELILLECLMRRPTLPTPREHLCQLLWDTASETVDSRLSVLLHKLREKLNKSAEDRFLKSLRGGGVQLLSASGLAE